MIRAIDAKILSKTNLVGEERNSLETTLRDFEDSKKKIRSYFPLFLRQTNSIVLKATRDGQRIAVLKHIPIAPCNGNLLSGIPEPFDELVAKFKSLGYYVSITSTENKSCSCSTKFLVLTW